MRWVGRVFGMGLMIKTMGSVITAIVVLPVIVGLVVIVGIESPVAAMVQKQAEKAVAMIWPLVFHAPVTQGFWAFNPVLYGTSFPYHTGVDMGVKRGNKVVAVLKGTVINVYHGADRGYGNSVWIEHEGGLISVYGHLDSTNVEGGQEVNQGDTIGWSGNTGHSTGPHLHFELRKWGGFVNPEPYLGL